VINLLVNQVLKGPADVRLTNVKHDVITSDGTLRCRFKIPVSFE